MPRQLNTCTSITRWASSCGTTSSAQVSASGGMPIRMAGWGGARYAQARKSRDIGAVFSLGLVLATVAHAVGVPVTPGTDVLQTIVDAGIDLKAVGFDGTYVNVNTPADLEGIASVLAEHTPHAQ